MERPALTVDRAPDHAPATPSRFGLSTPGGFTAARELQAVADAVGHRAEIVMAFEDFFATPPIAELAVAAYCGADPVISWEPWCWTDDRSPAVMRSLLSGALDDYVYRWADEIRDWGGRTYLRFAHEFNGDWYPWTPACGTTQADFVRAWRHVHDIFTAQHVGNVMWVWAPTVGGITPLSAWYPGDDYVDVLGVDGYNWGTSLPTTCWTVPEELFGDALDELRSISPGKPILVAEVGCAEEGGCKADWIARFTDYLNRQPDVMGFIWFEHHKETDWRITSSAPSAAAMAAALDAARSRR
ncbi:glycoside hydrolase family 26 protein [Mycobacterium sp. IDR2000157661]|uniref:glycoside hydrolase family 26 protein n=1 Tax=Mycobacterium sp. IDR2000157661 TaxID=2867005 RepID=UPI001EE9D50C|nr:glycosyl hydrolase [Mycobacterium sp. IDR2000157661]